MLTSQALRLSALVAAAMTAGYLWRAALESDVPAEVFAATPPALRSQLDEAPFSALTRLRTAASRTETAVAGRAAHGTRATRRHARVRLHVRARVRARKKAQTIAFVRPAPVTTRPRVTKPTRRWHAAPKPKPRPRPHPNPPPPPPPAPHPNPPPPAPPPPPPPAPQPAPPPPPPVSSNTKPGWGKGDKNHDHTGPPGQQKEKKKK